MILDFNCFYCIVAWHLAIRNKPLQNTVIIQTCYRKEEEKFLQSFHFLYFYHNYAVYYVLTVSERGQPSKSCDGDTGNVAIHAAILRVT